MVKYLRYLLPLLLLVLVSCNRFTAPERFEGEVYALTALLIANHPININNPVYISRSSSIEEFDPLNLFVTDASVVITDLDTNLEWQLVPITDLEEMKIKYVDLEEHVIQPLHTYKIEVTIPGRDQKITAQTTVPFQATLVPDVYQNGNGYTFNPEQMNDIKFSEIDREYPLALNTGNVGGVCNFMAEMFCLEDFSTDLEFTTPVFGFEHPDANMEEEYNSGGESIRRIRFMGRYVSTPQTNLTGNHLLVEDYRQAYVFFGRYQISLFVVDDNYYRYTYMPEGYFYGGVQGGLGYFGSASGGNMYANIIK
ncbi:MAG: hypothetical protein PHO32_03460 [Candidatus Cloacimonetes bacterium]|nr:hypothetical protein [Candidatus Cloacimonadota bacterium]